MFIVYISALLYTTWIWGFTINTHLDISVASKPQLSAFVIKPRLHRIGVFFLPISLRGFVKCEVQIPEFSVFPNILTQFLPLGAHLSTSPLCPGPTCPAHQEWPILSSASLLPPLGLSLASLASQSEAVAPPSSAEQCLLRGWLWQFARGYHCSLKMSLRHLSAA